METRTRLSEKSGFVTTLRPIVSFGLFEHSYEPNSTTCNNILYFSTAACLSLNCFLISGPLHQTNLPSLDQAASFNIVDIIVSLRFIADPFTFEVKHVGNAHPVVENP